MFLPVILETSQLLRYSMINARIKEDNNGWQLQKKSRNSNSRIDPAAALMNAYVFARSYFDDQEKSKTLNDFYSSPEFLQWKVVRFLMSLFNNWFGKNTTTTNHDPFLDALVAFQVTTPMPMYHRQTCVIAMFLRQSTLLPATLLQTLFYVIRT